MPSRALSRRAPHSDREECEKAGYSASIYGSKSRLEGTWSPSIKAMKAGKNNLSIWMAHWVSKSSYKGTYYMWQVNSHGRVPGISGDVDLDVAYIDRLPSPTVPVKPDDGGDETPPTDNTTPQDGDNNTTTPPENNTPDDGTQQPAAGDGNTDGNTGDGDVQAPADGDKAPEEGNATPDEGSTTAPADTPSTDGDDKVPADDSGSSDGEKPAGNGTIDSEAKSVDNSSAAPDTEETPAKEPEKEKEAPAKDAAVVKETAPGKQVTPSKEQPAEVTTEGPE